jgi:hypothetical protein
MANNIVPMNPATGVPVELPKPSRHERLLKKSAEIRNLLNQANYSGHNYRGEDCGKYEKALAATEEIIHGELEQLRPFLPELLAPATGVNVGAFVMEIADYWGHSKASETYGKHTVLDVAAKEPLAASLPETFRRLRCNPEQKFLPNSGTILEVLREVDRDIRYAAQIADHAQKQRDGLVRTVEVQREHRAHAEAQRLRWERRHERANGSDF